MTCPECGLEMHITACETRPEQEEGVLRIYHVARQKCGNSRCESREKEREFKTAVWESERLALTAAAPDK